MSTRSVTLTPTPNKKSCPCGCAPCEGTCCGLDCLERPRFFCGQLLTDQDLTALVAWTQDKLRLNRHRDGWGAVCGLEVRCDPKNQGHVVVGPGYATSCCGDDIIVCEDVQLDLEKACREERDPCADPYPRGGKDPDQYRGTDRGERGSSYGRTNGTHDNDIERDLRAVDIFIRYREEGSEPKHALTRGDCSQTDVCENSRTLETYRLHWQPAAIGSDPVRSRAEEWHERYRKCVEVLRRFREAFGNPAVADPKAVKRWLLDWIDDHPLHQFCEVRDWICSLTEDEDSGAELVKILLFLVQDCRNAFLSCSCHTCDDDLGVPLARVCLEASTDRQGRRQCHVRRIDPYPPYRRLVSPDCLPAPLGGVNLGHLIWHRWEEACVALRQLGFQAEREQIEPGTLDELTKTLECGVVVSCEDVLRVQVVEDTSCGERVVRRVVGFRASAAVPRRRPRSKQGAS
jgi:hypothetical protein